MNCAKYSTETNAEATYVSAAAVSTVRAPDSCPGTTEPVAVSPASARLDASNSTGSVTNWNNTAAAKSRMPRSDQHRRQRAAVSQDQAEHDQDRTTLRAKAGDRHQRHPQARGQEASCMLDRMPRLVRGDTRSRHMLTVVHVR